MPVPECLGIWSSKEYSEKKTINQLQYIGSSVQFWDGILRPG